MNRNTEIPDQELTNIFVELNNGKFMIGMIHKGLFWPEGFDHWLSLDHIKGWMYISDVKKKLGI